MKEHDVVWKTISIYLTCNGISFKQNDNKIRENIFNR